MNLTTEILDKAKKGDIFAFEQILFAYEKAILNHIWRMVGQKQDAEDLTQDTFIKVYKNLNQIKPEENFKAWLYKVATNTTLDWLRKKKRQMEILVDDTQSPIFETNDNIETYNYIDEKFDKAQVDQAMANLKPIHRTVLMMYYFDELAYQEIAESLDISINTVKTHIRRAKIELKKTLDTNSNGKH